MANRTRQVHKPFLREWLGDEATDRLLREHAPHLLPPFQRGRRSLRHYPGEDEADYLLSYLSRFPKKREGFLKSIRALQGFKQAVINENWPAIVHRFTKEGAMQASKNFRKTMCYSLNGAFCVGALTYEMPSLELDCPVYSRLTSPL
jgi:hypothetical protein